MTFQKVNTIMVGRRLSLKTRLLLSKIRKGKPTWNKGLKMKELGYKFDYVKKNGIKTRLKKGIKGKDCIGWKGGQNLSYWKKEVKKRDGKCMECGITDIRVLTADHIKSKRMYPELMFDVNNGKTLCHNCHALKTLEDKEYREWMSKNHWHRKK